MRTRRIIRGVIAGALALQLVPLVPLASLEALLPNAHAQDIPCATPLGSAEGPSFTPSQESYRSRLHALATGRGIKVALIDTGISKHEQFTRLEPGEDFIAQQDPAPFEDCDIHGTVVASVIGARDIGVAPEATLLSIRQSSLHYRDSAESESSGSLDTMAKAIHAAIDAGARVISLSVVACMSKERASTLDSRMLSDALMRAEREQVVVVASAGNVDGDCQPGMVVYPAVEDTVITVAALANAYELADYSLPVEKQRWVSAPGTVDIAVHPRGTGWMRGAIKNGTEGTFNGTSYATPMVSGTVALILERNPGLTAQQVRDIIYDSSQSANHVHDPLSALEYSPVSNPTTLRTVALSPETSKESQAPTRMKNLAAATGAVAVLTLFLTGIISSLRTQHPPALKQRLQEANARSAKQRRERRRPKHRRGRHRATRGAGRFLR